MAGKYQKKQRNQMNEVLRILSGILICVSAYMLASYYSTASREENAFRELSQQIIQMEGSTLTEAQAVSDAAEEKIDSTVPEQKQMLVAYAPLYEQNPDIFGWLRIEGTEVDYPVMHTPGNPEYYLHRAFGKTQAQSGVPFLDGNCYDGCGNYLIYGHHMKSGAMFAPLLDYADRHFWEEHPTITFDTLYEPGEYEVLAAFYAEIYPENVKEGFHYYQYTDLTNESVFQEYLTQVQSSALYDTGVQADFGDTLVTLSTCAYHTENGRFVVVARKEKAS